MGMNLKLARIKKGIRQIDLAKQLHISPSTLVGWERGVGLSNIKLGQMRQLSLILDVSIKELFLEELFLND